MVTALSNITKIPQMQQFWRKSGGCSPLIYSNFNVRMRLAITFLGISRLLKPTFRIFTAIHFLNTNAISTTTQ